MRIVVSGLIGQYAFGGVAWDYIQYLLGFQELGHEVWYLEDTGNWAYHPVKQEVTAECSQNVTYLRRVMEAFGFGDRWIYRNEADNTYHGVTTLADKVLAEADVLVNVSGACWLRDVTARIPCKIFLDGDPMFTQLGHKREKEEIDRLLGYTRYYTFGLHVGQSDCEVPTGQIRWLPTVQPISLSHWQEKATPCDFSDAWTTVMNWASYSPKEFQGRLYGQKDMEFLKYMDLPSLSPERFVVAMGQGVGQNRPTQELLRRGWTILEPDEILPDYESYRSFLINSKAEWSIAKHGYVAANTGWFSCRTACYLAAGRPAVVQETGWSRHLPEGEGVLSFRTLEEAADKIRRVSEDYSRHSAAARRFAKDHLDASKICNQLLEGEGVSSK
jgi:hypothetical protein